MAAGIRTAIVMWMPFVMAAASISRVITWPSATQLCQHNLLKSNEGLGLVLAPGAHDKQYHQTLL